jgi:UDP-4-amino-4-deoxy-L-arabinose formyltransferase/UDP-glucuronic acid dehydrogenase (UDP-4-keto-hexauronic acid decarboxylating)
MKAVVLGYGQFGCAGMRALLRNRYEIAAVFTHPDDPDEIPRFESVAVMAAVFDIPAFAPADINDPTCVQRIANARPDILFSFFYRQVVGREILEIPPKGCLNLHASLLPAYRGRCPINWVLIHGETRTGVTLHYMTARPDAGDIVAQREIDICPEDTGGSLYSRCATLAGQLLDDALPRLREGTAPRTRQDESGASYFGRRTPADGRIDWSADASSVRNLVRAVTHPFPGAFSHIGGRKVFFWQVSELPRASSEDPPGSVISLDPLVIACGTGAVRVETGQRAGGIFLNGRGLARDLDLTLNAKFEPCGGETPGPSSEHLDRGRPGSA